MANFSLGPGTAGSAQVDSCRVKVVDPDNAGESATAARLHAELFGEIGPIAKLGERLLRRYCYDYLLRSGMMKAILIEVDGEPAGLAAYSGDSVAVHRAALRGHLPFIAWETIRAIMAEPSLIARLPAAGLLIWERRREELPKTVERFAEMLAFGVLPPFRTRAFVRRTGLRVPDLLLDYVLDDVRTQGFAQGRGVVLASNSPAVAFFRARADRVEPYPAAARPSIQVWFDLIPKPSHHTS